MTRRNDRVVGKKIAIFIRKNREKRFPGRGGASSAAKKFGIDQPSWWRWEAGKATPDEVNQRKLAAFFGVSLAELRGDKSPPAETGDSDRAMMLAYLEAHASASRLFEAAAAIQQRVVRFAVDPAAALRAFDGALDALREGLLSPGEASAAPPPSPRADPAPARGRRPSSSSS